MAESRPGFCLAIGPIFAILLSHCKDGSLLVPCTGLLFLIAAVWVSDTHRPVVCTESGDCRPRGTESAPR